MNKLVIITAATAAAAGLAAYLVNRRRSLKAGTEPALTPTIGRNQKHLTDVFSRAKKQAMGTD